jgi:hypothetical protein
MTPGVTREMIRLSVATRVARGMTREAISSFRYAVSD